MGVGESTIRAIRASYLTRGNCIRKVGSGRRSKYTAHNIRAIMKEVRNNPFVSAPEVRLTAGVEHVSANTVLRVIYASGEFNNYWAARKPNAALNGAIGTRIGKLKTGAKYCGRTNHQSHFVIKEVSEYGEV